ncbi:Pectinesterase [Actinidia chinensis var. chinensis]|uniref:Pectinesterase n=1 Tax=Actinidia chinensis var. chinensis TaxID=1590841 RepID=A0A2R6PM01_ACTCC|nr:Pectinesterase [Actinidia chinensis var. chinensis]
MMIKLGLFVLHIITFSSFLFSIKSSSNSGDINWWCNKTPFPEPCKYYLGEQVMDTSPIQKYDFLHLLIQVAMEESLDALNYIKWLGQKCRNKRQKAAWTDCFKLYESTIFQLNQTLDNSTKYTDFDVQTWLSSALTNLDTCHNGFIEIGITKNIFPLVFNNVSLLISNCLAINNATADQQAYQDGFPSWVPSGDQRLLQSERQKPDLVVSQNGSGDFRTIKEALHASVNRTHCGRFIIHVRKGIYHECIDVSLNMKNIMLVGDGWRSTIVTGNRSNGGGFSTFDSATVSVVGDGFIARGITFRNTAGPKNGQAVSLISRSDRSVFYRCSFEGYQDTLCVHSQRQFYTKCHVFGTVDFIFGNAAVVFQNCYIHGRRPLHGNQIVITAQSRSDPNQNTGISIHRCSVTPAEDQNPMIRPFVAYLGRPWRDYARVVYLRSYLDGFVPPEGWSQWGGRKENLGTLYYGEYGNYGPGSSTNGRVKWRGYHDIVNKTEAEKFSVAKLIGGESWLPDAGVPFRLDL